MTTTPSQADLEYPRLEPSFQDFMDSVHRRRLLAKTVVQQGTTSNTKVFAMSESYKLPKQLEFVPKNLRTTGKNAGTISNHMMSAATALVMALPPDACGVENAWQGCFGITLPKLN